MRKVGSAVKVKATERIVSDKYRRVVSGPKQPVISKPVGEPMRTGIDRLPLSITAAPYAP